MALWDIAAHATACRCVSCSAAAYVTRSPDRVLRVSAAGTVHAGRADGCRGGRLLRPDGARTRLAGVRGQAGSAIPGGGARDAAGGARGNRPRSAAAGRCQYGVAARDGAADGARAGATRRRESSRSPSPASTPWPSCGARRRSRSRPIAPTSRPPPGGRGRTRWCSGSRDAAGSAPRFGSRRLAPRAGVEFRFYSGDLGIATAAELHIAAAVGLDPGPHQTLLRWYTDDVIEGGPLRPRRGALPVPSGPGLGVKLDHAALHRGVERFERDGEYDYYAGSSVPGSRPLPPSAETRAMASTATTRRADDRPRSRFRGRSRAPHGDRCVHEAPRPPTRFGSQP